MDDERQSLGATSLTGILVKGGRRLYGSFLLEGALCFKKARGCRGARASGMVECGRDSSRVVLLLTVLKY